MLRSTILLFLSIFLFLPVNSIAQDGGCVVKDEYEFVTYTGKHRTLKIPVECDSLVSMEHINNFLTFGDIFYERAKEFFGWEFQHPVSLETTFNPNYGGAGTGRGGTGYPISSMGPSLQSYDTDMVQLQKDIEGTIVHEGIHRWDFRGNNYFQGPDIAHPLSVGLDHLLMSKMTGVLFGQYSDVAPTLYGDHKLKINFRSLLKRYLSHPELDWFSYFDQPYTYEELNAKPGPEAYERLSVQGAPYLYVYFMHGEEGLKKIFDETERQRLNDPNWMVDGIPSSDDALERFIKIFGDGLQLDVSAYFDFWKYPVSDDLRNYLSVYPASNKLQDGDSDGFSPLLGDLDDTDPTIFPDAPELMDGIDNNQDGQVDEQVITEINGDLPGSGKGPELTLPGLVQGVMSDGGDEDVFHINLSEKTLVSTLLISLDGQDTCTFNNGQVHATFSALLTRNGGFHIDADLTGQNNNNRVYYLEPGEHIFKISNEWEFLCPGEYEIQMFVADGTPVTIQEGDLTYSSKVFDGLSADPGFNPATAKGVTLEEAATLKDMYNNLGGENWWDPRGWLASPDVCYWNGISCDREGLSKLIFGPNNFVGPLTQDMLDGIKNLREFGVFESDFQQQELVDGFQDWNKISMLNINYANISGPLPPSLGNKTSLWQLDLHANNFTGTIPDSWSNNLNMQRLNVQSNQLTGALPSELHLLTRLTQFYFDTDKLCIPNQEVWNWIENIPEVNDRNYSRCHEPPSDLSMESPIDESIQLEVLGDENLLINWTDSQDPEGMTLTYTWHLIPEGDPENAVLKVNTGASSSYEISASTIKDSLNNQGYTEIHNFNHYVLASDGDFITSSDTVGITLDASSSTSTEDQILREAIMVFPNPVEDMIQVSVGMENLKVTKLELLSIDGKKIKETSSIDMNTNGLQGGHYILNIYLNENKVVSKKLYIKGH